MAVINGTGSSEVLNGTSSDDVITGFQGNDTITGGSGNDLIYGDGGTAAGAASTINGTLGRSSVYTNDASGLASFKGEWLGVSYVTVKGANFGSSFNTYLTSGITTLGTGAGETFGHTYGIGVEGAFSASSAAIKAEINYDPNTNQTQQLSVEWSGGYVSAASVDLTKFYIAGGFDAGNEVGIVRAYLGGTEVDITGARISGGSSGSVTDSGLGVKFVGDDANGDFNFNISGANFDKLVFSTEAYDSAPSWYKTQTTKTDSSDYLIQEIKYTYHTDGRVDNTFNDSIDGGNGDDTIYGNKGDDIISGGSGADSIHGDDGEDSVSAIKMYDSIPSVTYNDTITGGGLNDSLYGDQGCDSITGDGGNDLIYGGKGYDHYDGDWDINTYLAEEEERSTPFQTYSYDDGNDTLVGGSGRDTIFGEAGDDWIQGGTSDDRLFGGYGDDTFYFESTTMGRDVIHDFEGSSSYDYLSVRISGHDKIDLSEAGITQEEFDVNSDGIINHKDVLIYNGSMIITFDPLPVYYNYVVVLNTEQLSVSDFIFAGGMEA